LSQAPEAHLDHFCDVDKGHGRIERRDVTVALEVDWLRSERRFPGELRLPDVAAIIEVQRQTQLKDRCRFDTHYYNTSAKVAAQRAAQAIRAHWLIENQLHWTLDVTFDEDQSHLRKGHERNDNVLERVYIGRLFRDDTERLEKLVDLYTEMTASAATKPARKARA
jgi:hypothetical protein